MRLILLLTVFISLPVLSQKKTLTYFSSWAEHSISIKSKTFGYHVETYARKEPHMCSGVYTRSGRTYFLKFDQIILNSKLASQSKQPFQTDSITLNFQSRYTLPIYVNNGSRVYSCDQNIKLANKFDTLRIQQDNYVCLILTSDLDSTSQIDIRLFPNIMWITDIYSMTIQKTGRQFKINSCYMWREAKLEDMTALFL